MSKKAVELLKDNWHLVLGLVAFLMMAGPESRTIRLVACIMFAIFIIVDVASTSVLRAYLRRKMNQARGSILLMAGTVVDRIGDVAEAGESVLDGVGKSLKNLADDIKE